MTGRIHSIESFGTVDGPGIRMVVFLQGCPLRCVYCHNPDTWAPNGGEPKTTEEILALYQKNRAFYRNGGITLTGGEPMLQAEFAAELFRRCKKEEIHTALDTSGFPFDGGEHQRELLKYTDLVMLDIKAIDPTLHRRLTGSDNERVLRFARYLEQKSIPLWVRHVVVPGYTDDRAQLVALGEWIGTLSNLKALDVLPYHTLGVHKYAELGIDYPLQGIAPLTNEEAGHAKELILQGIARTRGKG